MKSADMAVRQPQRGPQMENISVSHDDYRRGVLFTLDLTIDQDGFNADKNDL